MSTVPSRSSTSRAFKDSNEKRGATEHWQIWIRWTAKGSFLCTVYGNGLAFFYFMLQVAPRPSLQWSARTVGTSHESLRVVPLYLVHFTYLQCNVM